MHLINIICIYNMFNLLNHNIFNLLNHNKSIISLSTDPLIPTFIMRKQPWAIFTYFVCFVLKRIVKRERPSCDITTSLNTSFPSMHAAMFSAFALHYKNPFVSALAFAVSISRCILQVHYPTDIAGGAILAAIIHKNKNNLPNMISLFGLVLNLYVLGMSMFNPKYILWFPFTSCMDMLDGYVARKYNMCTDFGNWLDKTCDKIVQLCLLCIMMANKIISPMFFFLFIFREVIITVLRLNLSKYGYKYQKSSNNYGKLKTALLPPGFILCFISKHWIHFFKKNKTIQDILFQTGILILYSSLTCSLLSFNEFTRGITKISKPTDDNHLIT